MIGQGQGQGQQAEGECQMVQGQLDDLIDGELAAADVRRIERHLGQCQGCRQQRDQLRLLLDRAAALPACPEPTRDLWPNIAARIQRARRARVGATALAAAATLVLALAVLGSPRARAPLDLPAAGSPGQDRNGPLVASGGSGGGGMGGHAGMAGRIGEQAGAGPPSSWR